MANIYGAKLAQTEWNKIEKEFVANFYRYFEELNDSIQFLRKNEKDPLIRSQACLAFIAVDTFSRFHLIFQGERSEEKMNKDNEKRFKAWLKEFVFTSENKFYLKYGNKIGSSAGIIWKLRNSFIHFYSFPKIQEGQNYIGFSFNRPDYECQKVEKILKEKTGKGIIFIDVYCLVEAIFEGLLVQWKGLVDMLEKYPEKYFDSVIFAHGIVMQSGASTIRIKDKK